jgi:BolA-like protein 1
MFACFTTSLARNIPLAHRTAMSSTSSFPVTAAIRDNIQKALQPTHLEVINESHMHKVPPNSETHFKVVVVSPDFDKVTSLVERHRLVNAALADELKGPVHALSIVAKSPSQWQAMQDKGEKVAPSPKCRGGDGTFAK